MGTVEELSEILVGEVTNVIIGSVDEEGYPNMKALSAPRKRDKLKWLYFLTRMTSMRVQHYTKNPKASLYFCETDAKKGLMLKGFMEISYDQALIDDLWCDEDQHTFIEGKILPDCAALIFNAHCGRYFDGEETEIFTIGLE